MIAETASLIGNNIGAVLMGVVMIFVIRDVYKNIESQRRADANERERRDQAYIYVIKENTKAMQESTDLIRELKGVVEKLYAQNYKLAKDRYK